MAIFANWWNFQALVSFSAGETPDQTELISTNEIANQTEQTKPSEDAKPAKLTVYEYFSDNGNIQSGLVADERDWFKLNGKRFRIFSGSIHYFRVHPDLWRDRLRKFRAAGLNAIDLWVKISDTLFECLGLESHTNCQMKSGYFFIHKRSFIVFLENKHSISFKGMFHGIYMNQRWEFLTLAMATTTSPPSWMWPASLKWPKKKISWSFSDLGLTSVLNGSLAVCPGTKLSS